jgi:hypothetical protein
VLDLDGHFNVVTSSCALDENGATVGQPAHTGTT